MLVVLVRASWTWLVVTVVIGARAARVDATAHWVVVDAEMDHLFVVPLPEPPLTELVVVGLSS